MNTITITFGDMAENHVGMEKIGKMSEKGYDLKDLERVMEYFENEGCKVELIDLSEYVDEEVDDAYVLIVRNCVNVMLGEVDENVDNAKKELMDLKWDTKAKMYGRVVNKHARHNLCFADYSQDADFENGKGTIVSWNRVWRLKYIKEYIEKVIGGEKLQGEGNLYFDVKKCGIGFHGDGERKKVIACRFGASMPIVFNWFLKGKSVGRKFECDINSGDMYIMSEKATGNDWKKKNIYTLRHAAGCEKYTTIKE